MGVCGHRGCSTGKDTDENEGRQGDRRIPEWRKDILHSEPGDDSWKKYALIDRENVENISANSKTDPKDDICLARMKACMQYYHCITNDTALDMEGRSMYIVQDK
jgi:hypothetical protein